MGCSGSRSIQISSTRRVCTIRGTNATRLTLIYQTLPGDLWIPGLLGLSPTGGSTCVGHLAIARNAK